MSQSLLMSSEDTSRLNNILGTGAGPVNVGGVSLVEHGDLVTVDVQELAILLHFTVELAVGGVVLEHVHHVVQGDEGVIDGNNLNRNNYEYLSKWRFVSLIED